jgi:cell division protease FtsH
VAVVALFFSIFPQTSQVESQDISAVAEWVKNGEVRSIVVVGDELRVKRQDSEQDVISRKESNTDATQSLIELGVTPAQLAAVDIQIDRPSDMGNWITLLGSLLPLLFVGALFFFLLRQAQGGNNQAMAFGKSRARMFAGDKPTVTFADVAGADEAKEELQEIVEFLKEPQKFAALGARIPKGVLMVGAPGTGKTLMAKAVAGEAGVPFFSISGSEFVEMFVGVGASRVRDLFDQAKRNSPCIIFIDEIDAVGRHRGAGLGGSHDEREQTLNQILVEMDGFDTDTNIIIVAATNRPDILDPALLRPGRFDRQVVMDRPDMKGRRAILEVHTRGKPMGPDIDLDTMARQTPGFVGADLENMVNEAAILAARRNKRKITMLEMQEAVERVMAGPERRSRIISDAEKEIVAYHEAGHALVGHMLPLADPVHKISIISRGMALGYTMALPENDNVLRSQAKFEDDLAMALGGRAAEAIVFTDITNGAAGDLDRVTKIARAMVTQYGMSKKLGPQVFGHKDDLMFLGREITEQRNYSEEVAEEIDREVRRIVDRAYTRAKEILTTYREKLDLVAKTLILKETISADEFAALLADVPMSPGQAPVTPAPESTPSPSRPNEERRERGSDRLPGAPAPLPA